MSANRTGWALDAIDYEIVRVGSSPRRIGRFGDVHHVQAPVWRLVSGYLSLQEPEDGEGLDVLSHGHPVARLLPRSGGPGASVVVDDAVESLEEGVAVAGGLAVVADASTTLTISGTTTELVADGGEWGAVLVHGPAREKVLTRIALLRSLERVGGRRG